MCETNQLKSYPLVTIGLPVYNGEKYLSLALDSLLAQTFTDFELVISDNYSTDGTEKICKEYAKKDERIKYYRQSENIGIFKNFLFVKNKGVKSKYFMWAAHDDLWDKDWLKVLLTEFKPNDLAVRGKVVNIDDGGEIVSYTQVTSFNKGQVLKVFLDDDKNRRAFYWYALFDNQLLQQANMRLLDSTFGVDTLFILHLVEIGSLRVTEKTSQFYRQHLDSTTKLLAKDWFGLRRLIYHLFPLSTYLYSIRAVSDKYKPLILIAIPFKYLKSQLSIMVKLCRWVLTGKKY
jgi:glycosyltransferase involved in cell wall biosynthesis